MTNACNLAARLTTLIVTLGLALCFALPASAQDSAVFINEIHYDNAGADAGEAIEIAGPAGTDLGGWSIELYNGNGGALYNSAALVGVLNDDTATGFGFQAVNIAGIQNGSPDGIALVDAAGSVVQFLSYEGSFTAVDGAAAGQTSIDIGVAEASTTPVGNSLQLAGTGSTYADFAWQPDALNTFGFANNGQTFEGGGGARTRTFVNELHYDNTGTDEGEAIEIAGPAGQDLSGWSVVLYNGNGGAPYNTVALAETIPSVAGGFGFVEIGFPTNGIQNGAPDGLALVDAGGDVVQFLSYEGVFTAVGGPADGLTSEDIGIAESSATAVGSSLQLMGSGTAYEDFTWGAAGETFCGTNVMQTLGTGGSGTCPTAPPPATVFINEFHYDNAGSDTGEFVELAGPAGSDLNGWQVVLYNGNGGGAYNTVGLALTLSDDTGSGFGFAVVDFPSNGIQNGAPDGIALVDAGGNVVQFLSYEGAFDATDGPAAGLASTDIGVFESSATPIGDSLQLTGTGRIASDFAWAEPAAATPGAANNGQILGDAPPPAPTPIYEIQGSGEVSPLNGQTVTVVGVVTGDFQDAVGTSGDLNGFFLQDETGDGNAATSDGIFVFDGFGPSVDVNPGDRVRVTGRVSEFEADFPDDTLAETQINANGGSVEILGAGAPLAPTPVALPAAATLTNDDGVVIADFERYEGMLVSFGDTLTVTELFQLDRFGEFRAAQGGRLRQFTQDSLPDAAGFEQHLRDIAARNVIVDDGDTTQNPDPIAYPPPALTADNPLRMGDMIAGPLTGNVRFSRGTGRFGDQAYRIEPTIDVAFAVGNERPAAPDVGGRLRVASFNVLNFFTTIDRSGASCFPSGGRGDCRGADSEAEFDRQLAKLVTAIVELDADVLGLIELENNNGSPTSAVEALAAAVNAACADCGYAAVQPGVPNIGGDAIAVGLIYKTGSVSLAPGTTVEILDDSDLAALGAGVAPPVFDGEATNRAVLAATFSETMTGESFTVAVNHFKSKGASGLGNSGSICGIDPAAEPDCDQGDGAGFWDERRTAAAIALDAWLGTNPTGAADGNAMIVGDLNAYLEEDPIRTLEAGGWRNLVRESADPYSFVFDGQLGSLDYALVNAALSEAVTGVAEWHSNADESDGLDYNLDFGRNPDLFDGSDPYRAADHDPVVVGLSLPDRTPPAIQCNAPAVLDWPRDRGIEITATASDAQDAQPAVEIVSTRCTRVFGNGGRVEDSFCLLAADGPTLTVVRSGGPVNLIEWTVRASDASGNVAEEHCSVESRAGNRR